MAILATPFAEMGGHRIVSFGGWDVLPLTYFVVCGQRPPRQLPLVGRLIFSGTSVMVGPGAGWTCVYHGVFCGVRCPPPHLLDWRLLVLHDIPSVDPMSNHWGAVISYTGDGRMVAQ